MEKEHNTINDVINELKRLQVEYGDISTVRLGGYDDELTFPAWPKYNSEKNRIEF